MLKQTVIMSLVLMACVFYSTSEAAKTTTDIEYSIEVSILKCGPTDKTWKKDLLSDQTTGKELKAMIEASMPAACKGKKTA